MLTFTQITGCRLAGLLACAKDTQNIIFNLVGNASVVSTVSFEIARSTMTQWYHIRYSVILRRK